jgi:hypothetical protein
MTVLSTTRGAPDDAPAIIRRRAKISDCGRYRYWLSREWGPGPLLTFVLLNPSIADAETDDPTIRRCIGFAKREGADGCAVVNLFAWRATDPAGLTRAEDPIGPENAEEIGRALVASAVSRLPLVCAWGSTAGAGMQGFKLKRRARDCGASLACLGRTANGAPRHPLYVPGDQPLETFA